MSRDSTDVQDAPDWDACRRMLSEARGPTDLLDRVKGKRESTAKHTYAILAFGVVAVSLLPVGLLLLFSPVGALLTLLLVLFIDGRKSR